jgi:glycosyltransferase involved in cell wall biosynthesis
MSTLIKQSVRHGLPAEEQLRGRDMLCFSHDWNSDPLSKTHLMRLLARDNRILWVNSIGYRAPTMSSRDASRAWKKLKAAAQSVQEVLPNLFVMSPLVFPAWGRSWVRRLNGSFLAWQVRRVMRQLQFKRALNWIFNPSAAIVAGKLGEAQLIYYCVDEYSAFTGVSRQALLDLERGLFQKADAVLVSSEKLRAAKAPFHCHTLLLRHGVDYDHFRTALDPATNVPQEIQSLPRPILGYFGLMGLDWVDVPLLLKVAERFHQGSLVLLGKTTMDLGPLQALANVHILGRKPYRELPAYCKGFDVGLIPFPINETTLHSNPLKAREYVAAGLPVVSTAIPEVEAVGRCLIGETHEEFLVKLEAALAGSENRRAQSDTMMSESWQARLEEIRQHLAEIPQFTYG